MKTYPEELEVCQRGTFLGMGDRMRWLLIGAVVIGSACVDEPRTSEFEFPPSPPVKVMPIFSPSPKMPEPNLESSPMPELRLLPIRERFVDLNDEAR